MAIVSGIISAVNAVGAWIGGLSATGAALAKIAGGLALSKIAQALSGRDTSTSFGVSGQLQRGADIPQSFVFGRYATAGSLCWGDEWGADGNTPNAYLTQVIELSNLPIRGLAEMYIDGQKVSIDKANAHPQYGWPLGKVISDNENVKDYTGYAWVKFYDGTQEVADPWLSTSFTTGEFAIDADFVGHGNAYAIVTTKAKNEGLWNGFPNFLFVIDGIELLDPATGNTATNSAAHESPVNLIYTLMRGLKFNNEWFYGGQKITVAAFPTANWVEQEAKCRAAGYKVGGEVTVNTEILTVISETLSCCNGKMTSSGGRFGIQVVQPDASVFAFDDNQVVTTESQEYDPFPSLSDNVNGISVTHPSPAEGWQKITADPLYRPDLEAADDYRRMVCDIYLPFVTDDEQVQRLMKAALQEARRARKHSLTLTSDAWTLEPLDVVSWTSAANGYVAKQFLVSGLVDRADGDVIVSLTEIDPSNYNWDRASDFNAPIHPSPIYILPQALPTAGITASGVVVSADGGLASRAAISITWPTNIDGAEAIQIEIKRVVNGEIAFNASVLGYENGGMTISQGILPKTKYTVRARIISGIGENAEWSSYLTVTTPEVRVSFDQLNDAFQQKVNEIENTAEGAAKDITELNGDLASLYAVRAKAGGSAASFEMVAINDPKGPASAIRFSASDIILNGSVTAPMLNVNNLAAISANLGKVTAGSISADLISGGVVKADYIQGTSAIEFIRGTTRHVTTGRSATNVMLFDISLTIPNVWSGSKAIIIFDQSAPAATSGNTFSATAKRYATGATASGDWVNNAFRYNNGDRGAAIGGIYVAEKNGATGPMTFGIKATANVNTREAGKSWWHGSFSYSFKVLVTK